MKCLYFTDFNGLDTLWNKLSSYSNLQTKQGSDRSNGESKKCESTKNSKGLDGIVVEELSEKHSNRIHVKSSNFGIIGDTESTTKILDGAHGVNNTKYDFNENNENTRTESGSDIPFETAPDKTTLPSTHGGGSSNFIVEHQISGRKMLNVEYQDFHVEQEDSISENTENLDFESSRFENRKNLSPCGNKYLQQSPLSWNVSLPEYSDIEKQSEQYEKANDIICKEYDNDDDKLRNRFKDKFEIKQHLPFNNKTNIETNYDEYQSSRSTERENTLQFNQDAFQRYFTKAYREQVNTLQRCVTNNVW